MHHKSALQADRDLHQMARRFQTLGLAARLQVYRLIARHPDGIALGDLRQHLRSRHIPVHLNKLAREQLILPLESSDAPGYRVNPDVLRELLALLSPDDSLLSRLPSPESG